MRTLQGKVGITVVSAALLVVLAAAGAYAYLEASRRPGDIVLASGVIEGLTLMDRAASVAPQGSVAYSNALEDNMLAIELFLGSDTRDELPELTVLVERAWTAYLLADELWRLSDDGISQPRVSDVYAAEKVLEALPDLATLTVGEGAERRFDNTEMKAVRALFDAASEDSQRARELVAGLGSGR